MSSSQLTNEVNADIIHVVDSIVGDVKLFDVSIECQSLAPGWLTIVQRAIVNNQLTAAHLLILIVDGDSHGSTRLSAAFDVMNVQISKFYIDDIV